MSLKILKTNNSARSNSVEDVSYPNWNKRILVVDDEIGIGQSYSDILSPKSTHKVVPIKSSRNLNQDTKKEEPGFSFHVKVCHSYEQGLEEFRRAHREGEPYSMGFFDVKLGGVKDGYDLVKEIHKIDPKFYAVFVTAFNDRTIESISSHLGQEMVNRWDYLNKPFTQSEILQKARSFVALWNLERERDLKSVQLSDTQNRLLESERMSSVNAVARGVTHEFGNILMQIMGKADLARNKSGPEMKDALERILEASHRANEILDKFKNLSGNSKKPPEYIFVHHLLDEAIDLLEHSFKVANIKVTIIKKDIVKAKLYSTSLLQVIVNLSINAIHAMGDSGQIDYSVIKDGDRVQIKIRDYGPGIKKELLEKVLQPFFTTKGANGTGLGLSISKEIIEVEHQGEFLVLNHPIKGLEVILSLPLDGDI